MARTTIDFPDARMARVEAAFAAAYNYQDEIDDGAGAMIPNPQTKRQFVEERVRQYMKDVTIAHEAEKAATAARETAAAKAEGDLG